VKWSGEELLRGCGMRRFCFDHLPTSQPQFIQGPVVIEPSPIIDLVGGFTAYLELLQRRGEKEYQRTIKKRDKMERELGPVRFCIHEPSDAAIDACLAWKVNQYERTGALNVFNAEWVVRLLRKIATSEHPHFRGAVSTLYLRDELVAVHVGMRTASVLHHWFPAHNADHPCVKYSPGLQLLAAMIEDYAEIGIRRIDFGKGDYPYKRDFGTGCSEVAQGDCGLSSLESTLVRSVQETRTWLRKTAETTGFTTPVRWYRQMRDWLVMR
jgi:CelD/BcsL family acetyltransferase involved in cellulose biosynthesis